MCTGLRRRIVINIWLYFWSTSVEKNELLLKWCLYPVEGNIEQQGRTVWLVTLTKVWAYLKLHSTGANLLLQFGALVITDFCFFLFMQSFVCLGSENLQFLLFSIAYFCCLKVMLEVNTPSKVGTFGVPIYGSYKHQLHISYQQTEIGCF